MDEEARCCAQILLTQHGGVSCPRQRRVGVVAGPVGITDKTRIASRNHRRHHRRDSHAHARDTPPPGQHPRPRRPRRPRCSDRRRRHRCHSCQSRHRRRGRDLETR
ncbi:hypothetical protein ACFFX0_03060 [Citricoccus parietis]|uniref:Uncharacterized protein n=1 Tax=Citricoccus parietis TaxID=592307 RepID=A0ABV5FU54_9MICC